MDKNTNIYTNMNTKIISEKNGMKLIRNPNNQFIFSCAIENNHIYLDKIINFDLIKVIFDINSDIYEKVVMNKLDDHNAEYILIMKHFFADIGLPQRYFHFIMKKKVNLDENNNIITSITFTGDTISDRKPSYIDTKIEFLPINKIVCECNFTSLERNKMIFSALILFDNKLSIPEYVEKVVGTIVNKIFMRVKQFIENYRI